MRFISCPLLLALLMPFGAAQEPTDDTARRERLSSLEAEFKAARAAHQKVLIRARKDRVPFKEWPRGPEAEFYPRYESFAEKHRRTPEAAKALAWMWVCFPRSIPDRAGQRVAAKKILARMIEEHATDPATEAFARSLGYHRGPYARQGIEALRVLLERNPEGPIRKEALYSLAALIGRSSPDEKRLEEARKALVECHETFGNPRAASLLFELTRLQIGMVAPDFEATDVDGKAFRLSDYRGKVIVLTFWGFW